MSFPRRTLGYSTPESLDETNNQYSQSTWHSSGSNLATTPTQTILDWQLETTPPFSFDILDPWTYGRPEDLPISLQRRTGDYRTTSTRSDLTSPRDTPGAGSAHGRHDEYSLTPLPAQRLPFDASRQMSVGRAHATQGLAIYKTEEPNAKRPQTKRSSGTDRFECDWPGCQYRGSFGRNTELQRHIRNLHVLPKSYKCPAPGCSVVCNRGDNLKSHQRNIHGWKV
ncbi:hypothetical protein N7540_004663 [Penicillium herquei]|nr:hypothetical protein N7540_004663 [Penicillium herquei]